jgi:hypothetical protein
MNLSQDLKCFLLVYFGTLGDDYSLKGSKKQPSRHTTYLPNSATHLPDLTTAFPDLTTHLHNLATHLPDLATLLPDFATHLPNLAATLLLT